MGCFGGCSSVLYFFFNSAIDNIAPVCLTAEPELSVDALESELAARAAGRCAGVSVEVEGRRMGAADFCCGGAILRCCWVRCVDATDSSSDSPSLDA